MISLEEWLTVRFRERRLIITEQAQEQIGTPNKTDGKIKPELFPAFIMDRLAELQARCDALEVQVEAMKETKH